MWFSQHHSPQKGTRLLGELDKAGAGKVQDETDFFCVSKTKKVLKEWWQHVKRSQGQLDRAPTVHVWDNLCFKINN